MPKSYSSIQSWVEDTISGKKYSIRQYSIFLFCLAFMFYAITISNNYSLDDHLVALNHKFVTKGISGIGEILTNFYISEGAKIGEYRPIPQISFAIEYQFFGENASVSHFFNAFYYGILCSLLFRLWLLIFPVGNLGFILIGTVLFAIHPIHTEVVASLKNRENLFSMMWGVISCFYFIRFLSEKKIAPLLLTLLFFLIALLSKVDAVVFIPIYILIGYYLRGQWKAILAILVATVAIYFTKNIIIAFYLATETIVTNYSYETPLTPDSGFFEKLKFAFITLLYYLKLLIFPYPLRLYYGYNMIPMPNVTDIRLWVSIIIHLIFATLVLAGIKERKFLSFSILWYLISISIFSQLAEPVMGIVAERHAFIASAGFTFVIAFLLLSFFEKLKMYLSNINVYFFSLTVMLILVCFVYVQKRNKDWDTGETLIDADMPKLNNSVYAHYEYAGNLSHRADDAKSKEDFERYIIKAIEEYKIAAESYPNFAFAWYNVGISYLRLDSSDKAELYFKKAWDIDSTFRSTNYFLGLQAAARKDTTTAIEFYERELRKRPENIRAIERLYDLCVQSGKVDRVLSTFQTIAEKKVINSRVYFGLSNLYFMKGDTSKAQYWFNYSKSPYVKDEVKFSW